MNPFNSIRAPAAIQLNRAAFAVYSAFFFLQLWENRYQYPLDVTAFVVTFGLEVCSLLGLFYSFFRSRSSRTMLSTLGILVPAVVLVLAVHGIFQNPMSDFRPLSMGEVLPPLVEVLACFAVPVLLVISLFRGRKVYEYFARSSA